MSSWVFYGLLAALFLGLSNVPQKIALTSGGSISPFAYGMAMGLVIFIMNLVAFVVAGDKLMFASSKTAWLWTLVALCVFAAGSMAISLGYKAGAPASSFPALFNLNTLVAAVAGLILLKEYGEISALRIMLGASFAVAGALLVSWR